MTAMASQITSITIVYSTVYSGADQRKHQSSASLAFVWEIHRWPVNSSHKGPVTRKMFPFDDVISRPLFLASRLSSPLTLNCSARHRDIFALYVISLAFKVDRNVIIYWPWVSKVHFPQWKLLNIDSCFTEIYSNVPHKLAPVQLMAWHRTGDKSLSELTMG